MWHVTWSVNSLSHMFGYRNYDTDDHSRNNWFVAIISSGEGWHNNHHADQSAATVQHKWWEFDLNYYIIVMFSWMGLATNIVPPMHKRRAARAKQGWIGPHGFDRASCSGLRGLNLQCFSPEGGTGTAGGVSHPWNLPPELGKTSPIRLFARHSRVLNPSNPQQPGIYGEYCRIPLSMKSLFRITYRSERYKKYADPAHWTLARFDGSYSRTARKKSGFEFENNEVAGLCWCNQETARQSKAINHRHWTASAPDSNSVCRLFVLTMWSP